ncbi:permease [Terriglobus sp. RCC_193]|uniref:permease n=1 Tax=Terriglobus sp. RCC_193 TaxID=3239218 RepID=UPI00352559D9
MAYLHNHHRMAFVDWRQRSLLRANLLVLLSLTVSFWLSNFPYNKANPWLVIPLLFSFIGTADTLRCMRTKWNWYHGGVVLCAYMDLMCICVILFFLVYPFWL